MQNSALSILLFSGDYDKCLAAMILANGARDLDMEVDIFCAFWGLLLLRDPERLSMADKDLYEKMFTVATPSGAENLPLSKMNMAGMGKQMLLNMMASQEAPDLVEFLHGAFHKGVRFHACELSLKIMGFKAEELLQEVDVKNVHDYLQQAKEAQIQLFI
ncbi:MAG: DsrE/DsrF/DrsH-like family protein [Syntrophomonadaceae bacterium]|jgi:peroxiredoxin family protein